jgi:multidrug efflux system membrane fusion protein
MFARVLIILAGLAIAAGGLLWWLGTGRAALENSQSQASDPPAIPVVAGVAVTADVPVYLQGLGTVQAFNAVTVKSRVDGQIIQAFFTEGQEVQPGDRLFQIDPRQFQTALELAEAAKQKDEAQLASAQADLARYGRLVNNGYQTAQAFDAQKALVGQLLASIKADQAQIDTATLNLGYADIRAPIGGRTGARLVDPGNLIHASDNTALVTITQVRPIFVDFTLPQDQLEDIKRYQQESPLSVQALDSAGKEVLGEGALTLIDNQIDQTTGTIHLKATFDNVEEKLWPGQFVDARLVLTIAKGAVTVPATAVQQGADGYYAYVLKPDLTVERRVVDVTRFQGNEAILAKGIAAGEKIITDGQYRLSPGARVRVVTGAG